MRAINIKWDTNDEEWENNVRDEIGGCDSILDVAEIEKILNENKR